MSDEQRFNPTPEEAQELISDMNDDKGGRRPQFMSDATLNLAAQGGAMLPDFMGGPITRSVGSKPLNLLLMIDRSGSMYSFQDLVRRLLKQLRQDFEGFQKQYGITITMGVIAFDSKVDKFVDTDRVENIDPAVFDQYYAGGSTALCDALGLGILGDSILQHKWFIEGATGAHSIAIALTDSGENDSHIYSEVDVATMITDLRKTRRRTFGALLTVDPSWKQDAIDKMKQMGFLDKNILCIQQGGSLTDADLIKAFEFISSSVQQKSAVMSGQASASVNASESPDQQADTLLFS